MQPCAASPRRAAAPAWNATPLLLDQIGRRVSAFFTFDGSWPRNPAGPWLIHKQKSLAARNVQHLCIHGPRRLNWPREPCWIRGQR